MNGLFTDRVKKCMQLARNKAIDLSHNYVSNGHMLLGMIEEGDGIGIALLDRFEIDLGELSKATIAALPARAPHTPAIDALIPFLSSAKKLLEVAAQEARKASHKYIGTEHLLLALLKDNTGVGDLLADFDLDHDTVLEEIETILRGGEDSISRTPFMKSFGRVMAKREKSTPGKIGMATLLDKVEPKNQIFTYQSEAERQSIINCVARCRFGGRKILYVGMLRFAGGVCNFGQLEVRTKAILDEFADSPSFLPLFDDVVFFLCQGRKEKLTDMESPLLKAIRERKILFVGLARTDWYEEYLPPMMRQYLHLNHIKFQAGPQAAASNSGIKEFKL